MKMFFLEGLPGVGKTSIINKMQQMNLNYVHIVDELLSKTDKYSQEFFMNNDIKKINKYNDGIIVIDRGPISTLSYNETLKLICGNKDMDKVYEWFLKEALPIYQKDWVYTLYLKNKKDEYFFRYNDDNDPYGNIENQKKLEKVTLKNCKKYCKNFEKFNSIDELMERIMYESVN